SPRRRDHDRPERYDGSDRRAERWRQIDLAQAAARPPGAVARLGPRTRSQRRGGTEQTRLRAPDRPRRLALSGYRRRGGHDGPLPSTWLAQVARPWRLDGSSGGARTCWDGRAP